jgi:hypothetical protein
MKAFVITLKDNEYSNQVADRCIQSAATFGLVVEKYIGVDKKHAKQLMSACGLKWTWAKDNTANDICPISGLKQFPYIAADIRAKIGCSMSHYLLWKKCVELDEPILILEHDAVFLRELPDFDFKGICQINDPEGATRKGHWWSQRMIKRGGFGAFEKTWVTTENERDIPDGLAGNSAYVIRPWAAQELINAFHKYGVWPNDATMCKQLFPYLEEYYPFITKANQTQSTTVE